MVRPDSPHLSPTVAGSEPTDLLVVCSNASLILDLWDLPQSSSLCRVHWLLALREGLRPIHHRSTLQESLANHDQPADPTQLLDDFSKLRDALTCQYAIRLDPKTLWAATDWGELLQAVSERRIPDTKNRFELLVTPDARSHQQTARPGLVSVIIPTFNRPDSLHYAIESVLTQTYSNLELFVVDDNPPNSIAREATQRVIETFSSDPRIKYLQHERNRNGSAARNTAIYQATGEFVSFLDDDDIYLPNMLQDCVTRLRELDSDYGAVYGGFIGWNSLVDDPSRYKSGDLTLDILKLAYTKHYLCTNTVVYRRECLLAINGYDESFRRHQDLELNLRFFERFRINVVPKTVVHLRAHSSAPGGEPDGAGLLEIKRKFLARFQETIRAFPDEDQAEIYLNQWKDVRRLFQDRLAYAKFLREQDPSHPSILWSDDLLELEQLRQRLAEQSNQLKGAKQSALELREQLKQTKQEMRDAIAQTLKQTREEAQEKLKAVRQQFDEQKAAQNARALKLLRICKAEINPEMLAKAIRGDSDQAAERNALLMQLVELHKTIQNGGQAVASEQIREWQEALRPRYLLAVHLALGLPLKAPSVAHLSSNDVRVAMRISELLTARWLHPARLEQSTISVVSGLDGTIQFKLAAEAFRRAPRTPEKRSLWSKKPAPSNEHRFESPVTEQGRLVGFVVSVHCTTATSVRLKLHPTLTQNSEPIELGIFASSLDSHRIELSEALQLSEPFAISWEPMSGNLPKDFSLDLVSMIVQPSWLLNRAKE